MEDDKLKDTAAEVRKEAETSGAHAAEAQPAQQPEAAVKQEPSELDKLKGEQIQFDYPDQFKTQTMLEQVLTERLQRILAGN